MQSNKVNLSNASHFTWGENCDGWFLCNHPNLCVLQERMLPGTSEEKHYHQNTQQFFYILSGIATFEIENVIHILSAYEGIEIPEKVPHKISNQTDQDLIFLVISQPNHKNDRINIE